MIKNLLLAGLTLASFSPAMAADPSPFGEPIILEKKPVASPAGAAAQPVPAAAAAAIEPAALDKPPVSFKVSRADVNMRRAVQRLAAEAGWSFYPEYWAVGSDVPLVGEGELGQDFKVAVFTMLKSTWLTELPIKPCFYPNQVVRVVPRSEKCDKTQE